MTAGRTVVSGSVDWCTPPEYVAAVKAALGGTIALDPCSNSDSLVKAETSYSLPQDGLHESWDYGTIFVNPPYGRGQIWDWLSKCVYARKEHGATVIALIPVATNTKHWQQNVLITAQAICFLKASRLKFYLNGQPVAKGAPMACCLVYWGSDVARFESAVSHLGVTLRTG